MRNTSRRPPLSKLSLIPPQAHEPGDEIVRVRLRQLAAICRHGRFAEVFLQIGEILLTERIELARHVANLDGERIFVDAHTGYYSAISRTRPDDHEAFRNRCG